MERWAGIGATKAHQPQQALLVLDGICGNPMPPGSNTQLILRTALRVLPSLLTSSVVDDSMILSTISNVVR